MALDYIAPNASLARELKEVSQEAARVEASFRGINFSPREFPEEALQEICLSLGNLKNGTAEGCVEPLIYARYMLPLIRRDHFYVEGETPENLDEEGSFFTRNNTLDQEITRLYIAVGTALDEYRAQAQDQHDDEVGAEPTIEFEEDRTFAEISDAARDVSKDAEAAYDELSKLSEPSSVKAENLGRQIQDSANLAHSVRSQIRIRPIVARLYVSAGKALQKLPDVMIKTATAMKVGTDIAEIWADEWSALRKRLRSLVFDTVRALADALIKTGETLKKDRRADNTRMERQRDPEIVAAEHIVTELLLAGEPVPEGIARKVEIINLEKAVDKIGRPQDLLLLTNVQELFIPNVRLESHIISAFGNLENLTHLSLRVDEISDTSALGQLQNLTYFSLLAYNGTDFSALGQLQYLISLSVEAADIADISALGQLENLTSLTLQLISHSKNLDLSPISGLESLTALTISHARNIDLAPLAGSKNLKKLVLVDVHYRNAHLLKTSVQIDIIGDSREI